MTSFKLNIAEPKDGKCYKTEVKDEQASPFIGLNIGEKIDGSRIGLDGFELEVTGGTDYCGFPMRGGILGIRKKLTIYKGVGFRGGLKGMRERKTVCGHKIHERISQINLKVTKQGSKKLNEIFGVPEEAKKEVKTEAKEEKKQEAKEHMAEEKHSKEHKEEKKE